MNYNEYNELRCIAGDIIIKLYKAKERSQLELLKQQCEHAIKKLDGTSNGWGNV